MVEIYQVESEREQEEGEKNASANRRISSFLSEVRSAADRIFSMYQTKNRVFDQTRLPFTQALFTLL